MHWKHPNKRRVLKGAADSPRIDQVYERNGSLAVRRPLCPSAPLNVKLARQGCHVANSDRQGLQQSEAVASLSRAPSVSTRCGQSGI